MNNDILITTAPDFALLASIHQACFPKSWGVSAMKDVFSIEGTTAHIWANKGFGILRKITDDAEILTIAVAPEHQGKGIGDSIIRSMLGWAKIHAVKTIFLEVAEGNEAANELYLKHGFQKLSRRKHYYNNSADAIIMYRNL